MNDIWKMAKTGEWEYRDPQDLPNLKEMASQEDDDGKTPLHVAAQHGKLGKIPQFLLTQERIVLQDKEGKTVLHYSILDIRNGLKSIPKKLLSQENMLIEDINSNTLYHMLGYSKDITLLDRSMIKEEYLMKPNSLGITPIEYLCQREWDQNSLKFFKKTIVSFREKTLNTLLERGAIKEPFEGALQKELKKRAIETVLSKGKNTIELN